MMNTDKSRQTITVPGSKSVINRLLIIASMQKGTVTLHGGSSCTDVQTLLTALASLGVKAGGTHTITVHSSGELASDAAVFLQDAGTAGRFLLARVAAQPGCRCQFSFSAQLRTRPFAPLVAALQQMGAEITPTTEGYLVNGTQLQGGDVYVDASVSSQFVSALLMIAPLCENELRIHLEGLPVSQPYIAMTTALMNRCGVIVKHNNALLTIAANQSYDMPKCIEIEPDYSSASYFWALGALSSTPMAISHTADTAPHLSLQPDAGFINILQKMGAQIQAEPSRTSVYPAKLNGVEVSMSDMPDQVPTLAVLALFASSQTRISNIEHLVHKESNRIEALGTELRALGADIHYTNGVLVINPITEVKYRTTVKTYNDHRMAMALGLLLVQYPALRLDTPGCVAKSYPEYWQEMQRSGLFLDTKKTESK